MPSSRDRLRRLAKIGRGAFPSLAVLVAAALGLLGLLEIVGPCVWAPVELDVAEVAREGQAHPREAAVAVAVVRGAFRALGVSAWSARTPMLLASLVGLWAAYALARRCESRRAGLFALVVLGTTPAYALQGRLISGEVLSFAASLVTLAALSRAVLSDERPRARALSVVVALAASAVCATTRGALVGVGVPAAAVAVSALMHARAPGSRGARLLGVGLAVLALAVAAVSALAAYRGSGALAALFLGAEHASQRASSFDSPWARLSVSFFPWSAALPMVFAQLTRRAPGRGASERTAVVLFVVLALFVHALLARRDASASFVAVGGLGVLVAISLSELERRAPEPWSGRVLGALSLGIVAYLTWDEVARAPAKALLALTSRADVSLPPALEHGVRRAFRLAAGALALGSLLPIAAAALGSHVLPRSRGLRLLASRPGAALLLGGALAGLVLRVVLYPSVLPGVRGPSAHDRVRAALVEVRP